MTRTCPDCMAPVKKGHTFCPPCADLRRRLAKRRYAQDKAQARKAAA